MLRRQSLDLCEQKPPPLNEKIEKYRFLNLFRLSVVFCWTKNPS